MSTKLLSRTRIVRMASNALRSDKHLEAFLAALDAEPQYELENQIAFEAQVGIRHVTEALNQMCDMGGV